MYDIATLRQPGIITGVGSRSTLVNLLPDSTLKEKKVIRRTSILKLK